MINSPHDVGTALKLLTGSRNPSIVELDERLYKFYERFLKPVLKYADSPLVAGFVTNLSTEISRESTRDALRPGKEQPDLLAKLNHGEYPSYSWPGGLLILYEIGSALPEDAASYTDETEYACSYCAADVHNNGHPVWKLISWKVHTDSGLYQCPLCHGYHDGQLESTL